MQSSSYVMNWGKKRSYLKIMWSMNVVWGLREGHPKGGHFGMKVILS